MRLCLGSEWEDIVCRVVVFLWFCPGSARGWGGSGRRWVWGWLFLHSSGRRWIIGLEVGSLLNLMAHLRMCIWAWMWIGGMDASVSRAWIGVVLKAAQIRQSALCCTLSRGRIWYCLPDHQAGQV